jgi:uncharacterized protein with NRDE domain
MLKTALMQKGDALEDALFSMLADRRIPPDQKLPSTGIGLEWERLLSSIFIESPVYGTRSSTVLLIGKNRHIRLRRRFLTGRRIPGWKAVFHLS